MATVFLQTQQAKQLLQVGYILLPIIAGLDKYFMILGEWHRYLYKPIPNLLGMTPETFMYIIGAIEIIAGIIVFLKPNVGGIIVGCWLICIVINLILTGDYLDIALWDAALSVGAFTLVKLSNIRHPD